ncbi:hypothetical protein [Microtetraspora niveoalba]|uniref:hypothetical protein n=1 Tax=Microtetraspora niveoalba TaxID=46175 RepID=UPI00082BF4AC|nr:hypothetical protein [Microtetraspora niveoalba]
MTFQLGAKVSDKTAAKAVAGAAHYLLQQEGEQILFIGKTNQVKPQLDLVALTNMRVIGVHLLTHERPKVHVWWPQVRWFYFSDKWTSMNRLSVVTHEGTEIHFGTVSKPDVPFIRAQIERMISPAHTSAVIRVLPINRERQHALEAARLREQQMRAGEWQRYQASAPSPPPPIASSSPAVGAAGGTTSVDPPSPVPPLPVAAPLPVVPAGAPGLIEPLASVPPPAPVIPTTPVPAVVVAHAPVTPEEQRHAIEVDVPSKTEIGMPVPEKEFLKEIAAAKAAPRKWPYMLLICELAGIVMRGHGWIAMVAGLVAAWIVSTMESRSRRPRVDYDLPDEDAVLFDRTVAAFRDAARAGQMWLVLESQAVTSDYERKINAGAGSTMRRTTASVEFSGLDGIDINIKAPTLTAAGWTLHFYPDRFLIGENGRFKELNYDDLSVKSVFSRVVENEMVPTDAKVVDHTWSHVNVRGGPDRRFKDNRKLPIVLYGELTTRVHGSDLVWMISDADVSKRLRTALKNLGAGDYRVQA